MRAQVKHVLHISTSDLCSQQCIISNVAVRCSIPHPTQWSHPIPSTYSTTVLHPSVYMVYLCIRHLWCWFCSPWHPLMVAPDHPLPFCLCLCPFWQPCQPWQRTSCFGWWWGLPGELGWSWELRGFPILHRFAFYPRIKGEFPITGAFKIFALGETHQKLWKVFAPQAQN